MKEKRLCYISRTYYNQTSAGNKAKTDYEKVLHSMGAASIGLPCKIDNNKFLAFLYGGTNRRKICKNSFIGANIVFLRKTAKFLAVFLDFYSFFSYRRVFFALFPFF